MDSCRFTVPQRKGKAEAEYIHVRGGGAGGWVFDDSWGGREDGRRLRNSRPVPARLLMPIIHFLFYTSSFVFPPPLRVVPVAPGYATPPFSSISSCVSFVSSHPPTFFFTFYFLFYFKKHFDFLLFSFPSRQFSFPPLDFFLFFNETPRQSDRSLFDPVHLSNKRLTSITKAMANHDL
jgi:hypothetical protein